MLRELLNGTAWFDLPVVAMCLFLAMFLAVLLRVSQRSRAAQYRHMADLPLQDDTDRSSAHDR
jgi:cbb3-type cytochrome oxidase subunit 3